MSFSNYSDYKNAVSSEKITLAILHASKRLVAWTAHSGSVYKKTSQDYAVISAIKLSGVSLTQVYSLAEVVAGSFYNDRDNQTIYLWLLNSSNPANQFIHITFKLFYSNVPISAPWDLNTGFEVPWDPSLESTSNFGVEIDTINQQSEAIEGSGTLTLFNDQVWWPQNFDKLFFDNQECSIYSWNRNIIITEAKLIFKGKVESKSYSSEKIVLTLKDLMSNLRDVISLTDISTLSPTYRPLPSLYKAKKRMIFGKLSGYRPTNIDNVIDDRYPITGTVTTVYGSPTITGSGTSFLIELSPEDQLDIAGTTYTISSIASNTSLTLTENYAVVGAAGLSVDFISSFRKRFINRVWCLSGNVLCQPAPTILAGSSTNLLYVTSTENIYAGDRLYVGTLGDINAVGTGELVQVDYVSNASLLVLSGSLATYPAVGTTVTRFCVQNVKINHTELIPDRDFIVNPTTGILTLRDNAEINAGDIRESTATGLFTNSSYSVTGTGFKAKFFPGYVIRPIGTTAWYEISSVEDTLIKLKTAYSGSTNTYIIQYKTLIFNQETDILSCDILGRTTDGVSSSPLVTTAPGIVDLLLKDAGLTSIIDTASFTASEDYAPDSVALAIPAKYNTVTSPVYRDVINLVNKNVFGILYQTNTFTFGYDVLRPSVPTTMLTLDDSDIVDMNISNTNKNMVKTVKVNYNNKEWDVNSDNTSFSQNINTSDIASYIIGTAKEKVIDSYLTETTDAQRLADRWGFLLEYSTNTIVIRTKLLTSEVNINDIIYIKSRKMFTRFGGTSTGKIMSVQRIVKSGSLVELELIDLSNAFNRIALITNGTTSWVNSNEDIRIYSGYISDSDGMITLDEESFGCSLIW